MGEFLVIKDGLVHTIFADRKHRDLDGELTFYEDDELIAEFVAWDGWMSK